MITVDKVSPFFLKSRFDIPDFKKKRVHVNIKDRLFYSIYTKANSIDITDINSLHYNELNEKMKIAESIEKIKFKNKDTIMNNLMYDKQIDLFTLAILCMHYKMNLIFINSQTYLRFENSDTPYVFMDDSYKFVDKTMDDISDLLEISLDKPLKSIAYYKLADLQDMARRLNLPVEKNKKAELYESIKCILTKLYKIE
jgi:hypothetical protein